MDLHTAANQKKLCSIANFSFVLLILRNVLFLNSSANFLTLYHFKFYDSLLYG